MPALMMQRSVAASTRVLASRATKARAAKFVVRAASDDTEAAPAAGSTVFYAGKSYTEAEWKQAVDAGAVYQPAAQSSSPSAAKAITFADVMAFSGPAPEVINGRLSMLGFVAAVGAELSSGEGVLKQWGEEPTLIFLTFILFIAGSLVPMLRGTSAGDQKLGPFTPQAEMMNGRAAMLGFAALLAIEAAKGSPLF